MSADRRAAYDPFTQQPETMGELERWHHVLAVYQHGGDREPILLSPSTVAPVDRLRAYSVAKYAQLLSIATVTRMIGQYALDKGVSMAAAEATALQEAADFLAPMRRLQKPKSRRGKPRKPAKKKAERAKRTSVRSVELRGRGQPPVVRGKQKERPLTVPQYDVVGALLTAGEKGLTKDKLVEISTHADARGILRRLANSDPDWRAVIKFPGKPGVRYRIG